MTTSLKHPVSTYPVRLARFLDLMKTVKDQNPHDLYLWEVMDSVAFEDTEAALQTVLYNVTRPA